MANWDEFNPWSEKAVYVPLEELAEALAGGDVRMPDGTIVERTAGQLIGNWQQYSFELDAYILPGRGQDYAVGVRYGSHEDQYLSPRIPDMRRVVELHERYTEAPALKH